MKQKAHFVWSWLRRRLLLVLIILAIISVGSFVAFQRFKPKKMATITPTRQDITQTLDVSGEIDALEKATLRFQAGGKLTWIGVKEGDRVAKWQGIASLDTRTVEKNMKKKLLAYMNERWDFEQDQDDYGVRGRPLNEVGGLSDAEMRILEKAQYDLEDTVLDHEIQTLAKELSFISSPIDGIVTKIDTPVAGVNVLTTDDFEIVNPDTLYFSAEVDEEDIGSVVEGQTAHTILDAFPDQELVSAIDWIDFSSSLSDSGATVFLIRLTLPPSLESGTYRLGMNGEVGIVLSQKKDVLTIPFEALHEEDGIEYVDVLQKDGQVVKRNIETGIENDEYIEVISGITESDMIVISSE